MKKTLFLSLSALCALTMVIPSCRKEPVPEPVYTLTVKTGAADVDETDVTLNGSYTYDGTETVTVGFRYAADKATLATAQLIPATATDGKFSTTLKSLANGEYFYQAVASAKGKEVPGAEGFFKVDFSKVPTVTTGVADLTQDGYVLSGSYSFSSKKIPIKVGFFYAATEADLAKATLQEVTPDGDNNLTFTVPFSFGSNCFFQTGAIVEGETYRGEVKSAGMTDLTAAGNANCFIVKEAGWYSFKTNKPDGTAVDGDKADWLWATGTDKGLISNINYAGGTISFKVEKYEQASIVIALYKGSTIAWSWHIWMSDVKDQPINGYGFQDRNLGANALSANEPASIGLLYQWGRKDPFIGTRVMDNSLGGKYESIPFSLDRTLEYPFCADYVVNDQTGLFFDVPRVMTSEADATANPMTYYGVSGQGNWEMSSAEIANFWKADSNYNPCPAGYRVPEITDYTGALMDYLMQSSTGATAVYGKTADGKNTWGRIFTLGGVDYNWPATCLRNWAGYIINTGVCIAMTSATLVEGQKKFHNIWNWSADTDYIEKAVPLRCIKK